jgi:hypothetical protein
MHPNPCDEEAIDGAYAHPNADRACKGNNPGFYDSAVASGVPAEHPEKPVEFADDHDRACIDDRADRQIEITPDHDACKTYGGCGRQQANGHQ